MIYMANLSDSEVRLRFFFQAEDGIRDADVTGVQTCALPISTHLADRVRALLAEPGRWRILPEAVNKWLEIQRRRSVLPERDGLLIESFPRGAKEFLVAYCFEGRNAHQTLGMLLTRRMERLGLRPMGFVATD